MTQPPRPDALAKLRGESIYTADLTRPGMLHGVVVRSGVAAARIRSLDIELGAAAPGVVAVVTAADLPSVDFGLFVPDEPLLARGAVRYVGEPLALIAAETERQARAAARLVSIDYEPVSPILTIDDAMDAGRRPVLEGRPNTTEESRIARGDVEGAFATAHRTVTTEVTSHRVHQTYIEPKAALAESDGELLVVHTSSQAPFEVRKHLARLFDLPLVRIVVKTPTIGGGFGGKLHLGLAGYVTALHRASGRPVRMVSTREEEFHSPAPRENSKIRLESAVDQDGTIRARRAHLHFDAGAYAYDTPPISAVGAMQGCGPYNVGAVEIVSQTAYTNTVPTGSFRGPSGPQMAYAVEKHMNDIADDLDLDPLDYRLSVAMRSGSTGPTGQVIADDACIEVLERGVATARAWEAEEVECGPNQRRAVGLGCAWWTVSPIGGAVTMTMNDDASIQVHTGATEIGTGAVVTSLRTIVGDVFDIDEDRIHVVTGGTDVGPEDHGSQGSRTLYGVGTATQMAASAMRELLAREFARQTEAAVEDVEFVNGRIQTRGVPAKAVDIGDIAKGLIAQEGPLVTSGRFQPKGPSFDTGCVSGWVNAFNEPNFHCQVVEIMVDMRTGRTQVSRVRAIHDVGHILNHAGALGQVEGGVVQGVGYALLEEIQSDDGGATTNTNLHDYRVPTFADAPAVIEVDFVTQFSTSQAYSGAKGIGEAPAIPTAAAIGSALRAAIGAQPDELPMSAERILEHIDDRMGSHVS